MDMPLSHASDDMVPSLPLDGDGDGDEASDAASDSSFELIDSFEIDGAAVASSMVADDIHLPAEAAAARLEELGLKGVARRPLEAVAFARGLRALLAVQRLGRRV